MKTLTVITALAIGSLALSGCGSMNEQNASSGDLKGVPAVRPDKIRAFNNIDGHPNVVELCISHRAFLTTSRDAGNNLLRFPDDDMPYCGASAPSPYQPSTHNPGNDPVPAPSPTS